MNLIERDIIGKIKPFIKRKEAIIIKGMRQVGKTSLLLLIKELLLEKYGIKENFIFFFDLERTAMRQDIDENPENLLKYIPKSKSKKYIFIDEIQYLDNPSNFLKIIVDHYPNLKIFCTGSSSLDIKRKIQDSLIGRAVYFNLYPLNFFEFLNFKKEYFSVEPANGQKKKLEKLLNEYLTYGGFPAIVLERQEYLKQQMLKQYIDLYINKDIRSLVEIENINAFNNLAKIMSAQAGNLLNKKEISNTLNISAKTLNRYMDILCHTFIIFLLPPFFNNIRSRLTKMPKVYLYDLGIKNALVGNFSDVNFRSDNGAIFENFILLEILSYFEFKDLYFYRNTSQSEIDFIVDKKFAIEVKYKNYKEKRVFRVFDIFKNYNNYIVNLSFNYDAKNYKFIDWWQFLNSIKKLKQ